MIFFLSNHKDTSFLERYLRDKVTIIPHPYVAPEWSVSDLLIQCRSVIERATEVDRLVLNGDYSLVGIILLERHRVGKPTGFICMKKIEGGATMIDGKITHQNVLEPIGVRWL